MGSVPVHVPGDAVSVWPTFGVPLMVGGVWLTGGAGVSARAATGLAIKAAAATNGSRARIRGPLSMMASADGRLRAGRAWLRLAAGRSAVKRGPSPRAHFVPTALPSSLARRTAPEQLRGDAVDGFGDVYALCCLLFHCLTGQVPDPREHDTGKLDAHGNTPPPRPCEEVDGLSEGFDAMIERGMSKEPADRFQSAGD